MYTARSSHNCPDARVILGTTASMLAVTREVLIIKCKPSQTDIETIETIRLMFSFPISKFAEWLRNEGREGYANGTMPKT